MTHYFIKNEATKRDQEQKLIAQYFVAYEATKRDQECAIIAKC
jgi:hypothetical protein